MVQEDQAGSTFQQCLDALPVAFRRNARVVGAVVQEPDARDAGHVVEQHGIVGFRVVRPQQHLGRGLLNQGGRHPRHVVEHGEKGVVVEVVPLADDEDVCVAHAAILSAAPISSAVRRPRR